MRLAPPSSIGADLVEGADAARGLDAAARARYTAQQCDVCGGRAGGGETGGGLDEVGAGLDGNFCRTQFFFHGEQIGFERDLEQSAVMVGHVDDGVNVSLHRLVVAALEESNRQNHIEDRARRGG